MVDKEIKPNVKNIILKDIVRKMVIRNTDII